MIIRFALLLMLLLRPRPMLLFCTEDMAMVPALAMVPDSAMLD